MYKELLDMKVRSIFLFVLIIVLFFIVAPFQNLAVSMLKSMQGDEMLARFGLNSAFIEKLKEWEFFITTQWYGKNFGQVIPIIAVVIAFPLFARERENQTMEFLVTRNSRFKVFYSKCLTGFLVLMFILITAGFLPLIYSIFTGKHIDISLVSKFTFHALVGGAFWYSLTLLFSVISTDHVRPLLTSLGMLALTTVLGQLKPLKFINTFRYILGYSIFESGKIDAVYSLGLVFLAVLLSFASYRIFIKTDV